MRRKILSFLVAALPLVAQTGTSIPGPIEILPAPDHSSGRGIYFWDKTQSHFVGFIAPSALTITSNIVWGLPVVDGTLDQCLGSVSAQQIGWINCMTLDTPQTVTATKTWNADQLFGANILFTLNDAFNIGSASGNRANTIYTYNLDAAPGGATGNFVMARRLMIADDTGLTPTWEIHAQTNPGSGNTDLFIQDNSASVRFRLANNLFGSPGINQAQIDYNTVPMRNATWDLGSSSLQWHDIWISGTCHGCSSTPSDMMTTDTAQTVTGTKTFSSSILFGADDTYNIGASGTRANTIYTYNLDAAPGGATGNFVMTRRVMIADDTGLSPTWEIHAQTNPGSGNTDLYIQDNAGSKRFRLANNLTGLPGVNQAQIDYNTVPLQNNTWNLGAAGLQWKNLFIVTGVTVNGTAGVTCAGAPTASFASTGGIVTHC